MDVNWGPMQKSRSPVKIVNERPRIADEDPPDPVMNREPVKSLDLVEALVMNREPVKSPARPPVAPPHRRHRLRRPEQDVDQISSNVNDALIETQVPHQKTLQTGLPLT